jgi:tetratricopeptide (TPR) repeat protein
VNTRLSPFIFWQRIYDSLTVSRGSVTTLALLLGVVFEVVLPCSSVFAQHPIEVQRASTSGEHFKALTTYLLLPARRLTNDTRLAAAKSSWALGLHGLATEEIDGLLRDKSIEGDERARLTFMRGVIDYQEERYQEARLYAEKAISLLKGPSPLRARAHLLWGQAAMRMKAYGSAEEHLKKAHEEADNTDVAEVSFTLGEVQMRLGKLPDAEAHFKSIPMDHDRTPMAVRHLAAIALESGDQDKAKFWLDKGRTEFPEAFIDSWADYGAVQVALARGDMHTARMTTEAAGKKYPPSDPWLLLMLASLEKGEWDRRAQLGRVR